MKERLQRMIPQIHLFPHLMRAKVRKSISFFFKDDSDFVVKIDIQYKRLTKIPFDILSLEDPSIYYLEDYQERLTMDRRSGMLKYVCKIGSKRPIVHTLYAETGISKLLDRIGTVVFSDTKDNPADGIMNPFEKRDYTITVFTQQGNVRMISGTFDAQGLPSDWPEFIYDVFEFLVYYGFGELFDERLYGEGKRRPGDLAFCQVIFEKGGRTYSYLADCDDYHIGDLVIVPVGQENYETIARIKRIEYHSAENAPYPMDKIKRIRRKYFPDEENRG